MSFSFGYKQKFSPSSLYSTVSPANNATAATTTTTTTTTTSAPLTTVFSTTTTTSTTAAPAIITTTPSTATTAAAEGYTENAFGAPEPEVVESTTSGPAAPEETAPFAGDTTEQQSTAVQESRTDEQPADEQVQSTDASEYGQQQQYTATPPTLIQMHNQQQQREHDRQRHRHDAQQQRNNNAYAFESLEKAFATAVPHKIRSTKDLEQPKDSAAMAAAVDQLPWSWAKDIMLQKPVLKKSSQEVV